MSDEQEEFHAHAELIDLRNAPRLRREKIEELVAKHGSSWGPQRIAEFLFRHHRHLVPSETLEQAANLVSKDLRRMFRDIEDVQEAAHKGKWAETILRKRLEKIYLDAIAAADDINASEPYRATQRKLAAETAIDLAKLDGINLNARSEKPKTAKEWRVQVGTSGVAAARPHEEEDPTAAEPGEPN